MTVWITRRDFLKSTATLPAWSIFPPWSVSALPKVNDLYAIDFVWQCKDPFFEDNREFFIGGGSSIWGDHFDDDQISECIENRSFGHFCGKTFLVRAFLRSGNSGVPSQNQEFACQDLRSRNPLSSFHCPVCYQGWWLGHVAKGFETTFFYTSCDDFNDADPPLISKVTIPPPASTCFVRDGQEEEFSPDWELVYSKSDQEYEEFERECRNRWSDTNSLLPNQAYFHI